MSSYLDTGHCLAFASESSDVDPYLCVQVLECFQHQDYCRLLYLLGRTEINKKHIFIKTINPSVCFMYPAYCCRIKFNISQTVSKSFPPSSVTSSKYPVFWYFSIFNFTLFFYFKINSCIVIPVLNIILNDIHVLSAIYSVNELMVNQVFSQMLIWENTNLKIKQQVLCL